MFVTCVFLLSGVFGVTYIPRFSRDTGLFYPCHVATPSYPPRFDYVNFLWSSLCNEPNSAVLYSVYVQLFFLSVRFPTFVECAVCFTLISFDMYSRIIEGFGVLWRCACHKYSSFRKGGSPWLAERLSASRGLRCIVELGSKLPEWSSLPQTMGTVQCDIWQHIIQVWNCACDHTHGLCSLD